MNSLTKIDKELTNLSKIIKKNTPTILTILGIGGFVSSTVLAVKATPKAMDILEEVENELPEDMPKAKKTMRKVKAVLPVYSSSIIMGITSGLCVAGANKINSDRVVSAITACELRDKILTGYQNKVIETIGEKKEQSIRDEIAKDQVANTPIDEDIIQTSTGTQLFLDSVTGQYFRSTKDDIYKALVNFQRRLFLENYMTHREWLNEIDDFNDHSTMSDKIGYNSTVGMGISFSVVAAPNGEPVTVVEYDNPPTYDFCFNHYSDRYWN